MTMFGRPVDERAGEVEGDRDFRGWLFAVVMDRVLINSNTMQATEGCFSSTRTPRALLGDRIGDRL